MDTKEIADAPPAARAQAFSRYLRTRERGPWTAVFHELHPDVWYVSTAF